MQVVNLFAGPGVGKSLISAAVFVELKKAGLLSELCLEYAKDLVYDKRQNILKNDQLYIFSTQNRKLQRLLENQLEYAICDSPLLLSIVYSRAKYMSKPTFRKLVLEVFNSYNNINFFIERGDYTYQQAGRLQTLEQAKKIDDKIKKELEVTKTPYITVKNNNKITSKIIEHIFKHRLNGGKI